MEEKDTRTPQENTGQGKQNGGNFHRRRKGKHHGQNRNNQNQPRPSHGQAGTQTAGQNQNGFRHVSADQAFGMGGDTPAASGKPQAETTKNAPQKGVQDGAKPFHKKNRRSGRNRHRSDRQNTQVAPILQEAGAPFDENSKALSEETVQETQAAQEVVQEILLPPTEADAVSDIPASQESAEEEQTEIVGVHFKHTAKVYYFDPCGLQIPRNANVIVQTANGTEYGSVSVSNRRIPNRELVLPLRPVLRVATEEDEKRQAENADREIEAYNACIAKIAEHKLDMKLVDTDISFDRSKILFYFIAEERVDFRELVKELAAAFHTRIEMRQIGIRDEAKMLGGLGICGRPFCCSTFLPDFAQVSIKMAKEQNLSLNSAKISGACGRLMCCLRYEHSTYEQELKITPKVDSLVTTADGDGVVIESNPLTGLLKVRLDGEENPRVYARESVTVNGHQKGAARRSDPRLQKVAQKKEENAKEKARDEAKNTENQKKS